MELNEARELLFIDKHNLDEELIAQPQLFSDVCDECALAVSRRDEAKDQLKELEAELGRVCRDKLLAEKEKVTEAMVNAAVAEHPKRVSAVARLRDCTRTVEEWESRKSSFQQRASALKTLCELYMSNYYVRNTAEGAGRLDEAEYNRRRKAYKSGRDRKRVTVEDE